VVFEPVMPEIIRGMSIDDTEEDIFPSPAVDFELRQLNLVNGLDTTVKSHTAEIFFIYKGKAVVECGKESIHVSRGESVLALAGSELYWTAMEDCTVFHATVPYPQT